MKSGRIFLASGAAASVFAGGLLLGTWRGGKEAMVAEVGPSSGLRSRSRVLGSPAQVGSELGAEKEKSAADVRNPPSENTKATARPVADPGEEDSSPDPDGEENEDTSAAGEGPVTLADLLGAGVDLRDPDQRAAVVERLRRAEEMAKAEADAFADREGLPKRVTQPNGQVIELQKLEDGRPRYKGTRNANAAISTGVTLVRQAPFLLDGTGVTIGLWDGGSARPTHQEFAGRVTAKDGASPDNHATHVGGTLAARGVVAQAKGMAPAVRVDSYDWNSDVSEMTSRGASYPGEAGKLYVSNHSYGFLAGWNKTGLTTPAWSWYGSGTTAAGSDPDFGRYTSDCRDADALACNLPYYLVIRAAGNDREDDPVAGDLVSLSTSTSSSRAVSYDPAVHPAGDPVYKNGYDTVSYDEVAKNVLSVGAVSDAVNGGTRSVASAQVLDFSSWGPTDDGRIKPDVMGNGERLYSSLADSDSSYASYSGTSMAAPNVTGSAALLIELFDRLYPGQAMRAGTLKGLLIHTADDLGTPGPDYQTGWGLVNVKTAAEVLQAGHDAPGTPRVWEDQLVEGGGARDFPLIWDGISPIRATLSWTDPAGTTTYSADSRKARLVNNLDMKVTGPEGTAYSPWVMPYVGNWSPALFPAPAVTGKNNTDNVEQVLIGSPPQAGTYVVNVSVDGSLTRGAQNFSLILSGGATGADVPLPAPVLTAVSPDSATSGTQTLVVAGGGFQLGARVILEKTGQANVEASGLETVNNSIRCRLAVGGMRSGGWDVVVRNPNGAESSLPGGFSVTAPLLEDTLEDDTSGWSNSASEGTASPWVLTEARSYSATHSFYTTQPLVRNIADLYAPIVEIPSDAQNLQLGFWHSYSLSTSRAGGVLEYSLDGGTAWTDVTAADSGTAFISGGYHALLKSSGSNTSSTTGNPLAGRNGWSGTTSSFTHAVVGLTDTARFAGKSLRLRWRLATGKSSSGAGSGFWYVDDLLLSGNVPSTVVPPTVTAAATATPITVTGTTSALHVAASDGADGSSLVYTWSATGEFQSGVEFSGNGSRKAADTIATFSKSGHYVFTVTIRGEENLSVTSSVEVEVKRTPSSLEIDPPPGISLSKGKSLPFFAKVTDQFGLDMDTPPDLEWSATAGSVTDTGIFTAGSVAGIPFIVRATLPGTEARGELSTASGGAVVGQYLTDWAGTYFDAGVGSFNLLDGDHDTVLNVMEYALGTDPTLPGGPPVPVYNAQDRTLTMSFHRPRSLPGVTYAVEVSADLENWEQVSLEVTAAGDPEQVSAVFPVPLAGADRWFMRLKVTLVE